MQTGDIVLTGVKSQGFLSWLIKLGAFVGRYPKEARQFSHAVLVYDADGTIAEAVKKGVVFSNISHYKTDDILLIPMNVSEPDQVQVRAFADAVVEAHTTYGFVTFVACGINCVLASMRRRPIILGVAHTKICSAFVADALTRAGVIWDKPQEVTMPADIFVQLGAN